jgi:HSP20 family molecular chaperone IbpA
MQEGDTVTLTVYVPGVDASGIEITRRGPDLTITARKSHFVRVNWRALHLENAQLDYRLKLRLGNHLDYDALRAELIDGVLTLALPKSHNATETLREVA